jgi:hypothetical protein
MTEDMAEFIGFFTARVSPEASGVPYTLHFGYGEVVHLEPNAEISSLRFWIGDYRDTREWFDGNIFPVSLDQPECPAELKAADFQRIMEFVKLNRSAIVGLWGGKVTDPEFHAHLKKLPC